MFYISIPIDFAHSLCVALSLWRPRTRSAALHQPKSVIEHLFYNREWMLCVCVCFSFCFVLCIFCGPLSVLLLSEHLWMIFISLVHSLGFSMKRSELTAMPILRSPARFAIGIELNTDAVQIFTVAFIHRSHSPFRLHCVQKDTKFRKQIFQAQTLFGRPISQ